MDGGRPAVVRLRRAGRELTQIADGVRLSETMVPHYCLSAQLKIVPTGTADRFASTIAAAGPLPCAKWQRLWARRASR